MITFNISLPMAKRLADKLPEDFNKSVVSGIRRAILIAEAGAKKLSPVDTGHLRRSIHSGVNDTAGSLLNAWIGSDLVYSRIQEIGGKIFPTKAKALRFKIGDKWITTKSVTIKGKFYLQRGMTENTGRIIDTIRNTVIDAMEKE